MGCACFISFLLVLPIPRVSVFGLDGTRGVGRRRVESALLSRWRPEFSGGGTDMTIPPSSPRALLETQRHTPCPRVPRWRCGRRWCVEEPQYREGSVDEQHIARADGGMDDRDGGRDGVAYRAGYGAQWRVEKRSVEEPCYPSGIGGRDGWCDTRCGAPETRRDEEHAAIALCVGVPFARV
jgi:hypothetical protein